MGGRSPTPFGPGPSLIACRFASEPLPDEETIPHLSALIRTYLSTMADMGVETWIMHGTLLAWWWNQKVGAAIALFEPCLSLTTP